MKLVIIIGCILLIIATFFLVKYILKRKTKKHLSYSIDKLTTEKNLIISSTLITELSRAEKLVNNEEIGKQVESWKKTFEEIEKKDLDELADLLNEADGFIEEENFEEASTKIEEIEKAIFKTKAKSSKLLFDIKDLTESEERNREAITKLKSMYREVVFKYNKDKNDYGDLCSRIELQFENIDKLFSAFEVSIQNKEYTELSKIVKVLDDMINNISMVIEEAPTIIMMATLVLPKKMNDIKTAVTKLKRDGYNVEYLNIEYNIEETNKKIGEIMDRLNVLNLEDSVFDLKTLLNYYDSLYSDFDAEKRGKKDYERYLISLNDRLSEISAVLRNLYAEIDDIKESYDLSEQEISVVDELNRELIEVKDNYKRINDRTLTRVMPYSKLSEQCTIVSNMLSQVEEKMDITLKTLGSLKEDEERARGQLVEIKEIINNSKYRIKDYNLPVIPEKFYIELKEAHDSIKEVNIEIEKKPISIKTLNVRVDTARDLALKLLKTASDTVKYAYMSELAIMYGNRYRSSNKEVELGLESGTKSFRKGAYKEALDTVINAINIVEPGVYKKLFSKMEG